MSATTLGDMTPQAILDEEVGGTRYHELLGRLTGREHEVLELLMRGLSTQAMATELGRSRTTTRNHIQRILKKLEVHNRSGAIAIASRRRSRGWSAWSEGALSDALITFGAAGDLAGRSRLGPFTYPVRLRQCQG